jgi:very-short-patch-repair endonuclease
VSNATSTGLRQSDAPPSRDALIAEFARRQYGLITIWQLTALGLTSGAVTHRVRTGRLHRIHRGVYAVGHSRLSQEARWMAAVLAAGEGFGLSHLSAAVHLNAWRRAVKGIDVIGPRRRTLRGVRVHTCRNLDPRDLTIHRGIPVTTMARTLVDLTDVLTEHQLANVIHEAAFHNRFSEQATRAAMARAPGRNVGVLERALEANATGSAGTKSDLEDQVLAHIQATDLPAPLVNAGVQTPRKLIEVDLFWPTEGLVVEVDGHGHNRPRTQREDAERNQLLTEAGLEVVRVKPPPRPHPAADPRPP